MDHVRKNYFYTYLLQSENGKWYIGLTKDLRKRFSEHQKNQSGWTRAKGPFSLLYYEACLSLGDARAREKYLKSGMGRRYLRNRLKLFLT